MPIDLERGLVLAGGLLNVVVGAGILALAPGRPLHRAFAGVFAARGLTTVLPTISGDPAWAWAALRVQPYFTLALVPLALYAAVTVHRDEAAQRRGGWWTAAAIAALATTYTLDHALFHTLAPGTAPLGALQAARGIQYTGFGPLAVLGGAMPLVLAYVGLRLAVLYRQRSRSAEARPWLLLSGAFFVGALYDAAARLTALTSLLDAGAGYPWMPWGWSIMVLPPLAIVPALLGVAVLTADRAFLRPEHRLESLLLATCVLAFASGMLRLALPSTSDPAGGFQGHLLLGAWRLVGPALAAAAFLLPAWQAASRHGAEAAELVAWGTVLAASGTAAVTGGALAAAAGLAAPVPVLAGLAAASVAAACGRPVARTGRAVALRLLPDRWASRLPAGDLHAAAPVARGRRPARSFPPSLPPR